MNKEIDTIKIWLGSGSLNFFGRPFAGKDTQGNKFAEMFNGIEISSGSILRKNEDNEKLQQLLAAGEIIPSDLFEEIVVPFLSNPEFDNRPLILSEVGRMEGEQQVIMRATEKSGHPTKAAIYLKLSEDDVYERFEVSKKEHDRGDRSDDRRDILTTRLEKYSEKVVPVIEWYRNQELLIEVDGTLSAEDVTIEIINALAKKASS